MTVNWDEYAPLKGYANTTMDVDLIRKYAKDVAKITGEVTLLQIHKVIRNGDYPGPEETEVSDTLYYLRGDGTLMIKTTWTTTFETYDPYECKTTKGGQDKEMEEWDIDDFDYFIFKSADDTVHFWDRNPKPKYKKKGAGILNRMRQILETYK